MKPEPPTTRAVKKSPGRVAGQEAENPARSRSRIKVNKMTTKQQPTGICDHCLGPIPRAEWYTSKGGARLHCSVDCKNTANSRAGNPVRVEKLRARVAAGEWENPHLAHPPTGDEQARRARLGRLREVWAETWRNPALDDRAREKLSRPRKHTGTLASAIEKLGQGLSMAELTDEEVQAHREYRQKLFDARREEANAKRRAWYHKKQATLSDDERNKQTEKWREQNRKRAKNDGAENLDT